MPSSSSSPTALIADDEALLREALARLLAQALRLIAVEDIDYLRSDCTPWWRGATAHKLPRPWCARR